MYIYIENILQNRVESCAVFKRGSVVQTRAKCTKECAKIHIHASIKRN